MHHVKSPRLRLAAMALAAAWIGAGCHDDVTVAGTSTTPERSSETGAARSLDGIAQDFADASNGVVSVTDAACVAERVVQGADLCDAGVIFGTGFAPFRGGPLHYRQVEREKAQAQRVLTDKRQEAK